MNIVEYGTVFLQNQITTDALFSSRVITHQTSANLAPIQTAFRQLANNPLINNTITKTNISEGASAPWVMARVEALFNAIYTSGMTTDKDIRQIQALSQEIEKIKKNLKNIQVSSQEKQLHKKCLKLAEKALFELTSFPKALDQYHATKRTFENAFDLMVDRTYSPLYPGEALSSFVEIPQAIEALQTLEQQIETLPENSSIRLRLQENLDGHLYEFSFFLYDWHQEINEFVKKETSELLSLYQTLPSEKKGDILRQLSAITTQQSTLISHIESFLKNFRVSEGIKVNDALVISLDEAVESLRTSAFELEKQLNRKKIDPKVIQKPMIFGNEEWCALSVEREQQRLLENSNRTFFGDLIHSLTDVENWSDRKKSIISNLFTAIQIGQHGLEFSQKINQAQYLRAQAEAASKKITPEMERNINRNNAYLGTLLTDKYQHFLDHPELIDQFSKGNDLLNDGIQRALKHFGSERPDRTQLFEYLDAFKSRQYAQISQSPFAHLSISEWMEIFTTPEKEAVEEANRVISENADQRAVIPRRTIGLMGREQQFASIMESEMKGLIQAKDLLKDEIQKYSKRQISPNNEFNPLLTSLQEEINLLEHNPPTETSTLTELARWMQSIEDIVFAISTKISAITTVKATDEPAAKFIQNAFHIAVENEELELIPYLIGKADINEKNSNGDTPLDIAIRNKNLKMVKALIESFADISYLNKNQETTLHAAMSKDIHIFKLLLEKTDASSLNIPNSKGKTLLDLVMSYDYDSHHLYTREEMIKLLLSHGAHAQVMGPDGLTPPLVYKLMKSDEDYQKVFGRDNYAEVASSLKILSHAFEIEGHLPLGGQLFELEGGASKYFSRVFRDYITKFAEQFPGLKESDLRMLQNSLKSNEMKGQELYEEYLKSKSILINTGFIIHAVSVCLYDEYIIIGNKGMFSNKPLQIYKINKNKITPEYLMKIQDLAMLSPKAYYEWINNFPMELEGEELELTTSIEEAYPLLFTQVVGNCAWESTETILFGMIALKRLLEADPELSKVDMLKEVQKTFVEMTQFFQLEAFENYLKTYLCEYHHMTPKLEGDREHYLSLKHVLHEKISQLPKTFSEKRHTIESLLSLVDKEFVPNPLANQEILEEEREFMVIPNTADENLALNPNKNDFLKNLESICYYLIITVGLSSVLINARDQRL